MRSRLLSATFAAVGLLLLSGCATATPTAPAESSAAAPSAPATAAASGECAYPAESGASSDVTAPPADPTVTGAVSATLSTTAGDIAIALDADRTPCTVGSFVSLAEQQYFDGTDCHRLTTQGIFVLQCGDPTGTGRGGPGYSFDDELDGSETYPAGTVAMANAGPDTNGSQFFLVYEDSQLPPSYTVFGQMDAAGLEVVRQIAAVGAEGGAADGAPATPVTITSVAIG
ncbi:MULTISPECIES: peptidylprolyl isomerase [unclassified Microbacterium]|uniref:peptidylprolyl isomerase n=1 Tax=unclassified Microbacterium TaxID=2609290 RepID=UPI003744F4C9